MNSFWQDVTIAVRLYVRKPLFTIVVLAVLGLAIGVNSAIFTVVNAVLLRPLPVAAPEQLVFIWQTHPFGKRIGIDQLPPLAMAAGAGVQADDGRAGALHRGVQWGERGGRVGVSVGGGARPPPARARRS